MFKRILAAVDGSKTSLKALDKAIELQRRIPDAEIFIICVYKHHSLFEASLSVGRPDDMDIPDKVLSDYAKEVVNHAKEFAKEHGATKVRGFVKAGGSQGDCGCPRRSRPDRGRHQGHQQRQRRHVPRQCVPPGGARPSARYWWSEATTQAGLHIPSSPAITDFRSLPVISPC